MKHLLKIWSLLMLFIHLSSLAFVSFLPTESAGVAIKKVCLRQQAQTKVSSSHTAIASYERILFVETGDTEKPESEAEIRLCQVKLFCTPASNTAAYTHLHSQYQEPGYMAVAYYSQTTPTDPDPPRLG